MTLSLSRAVSIGVRPPVLLSVLFLFWQAASPPMARAVSPNLVISQVYGGGGNSGATYRNDFVEVFNRGGSSVTFSNWTLQYSPNANTSAWTVLATISGTLQPGQYFLVGQAGGTTGAALPPTDS